MIFGIAPTLPGGRRSARVGEMCRSAAMAQSAQRANLRRLRFNPVEGPTAIRRSCFAVQALRVALAPTMTQIEESNVHAAALRARPAAVAREWGGAL